MHPEFWIQYLRPGQIRILIQNPFQLLLKGGHRIGHQEGAPSPTSSTLQHSIKASDFWEDRGSVLEQCQTRNLDQMWSQRPFVDATTFQPASCILATFHPPPFSPLSLLDPFVTSPHCPFPSVSPSNQTAAGPAEWCLGRGPGGCSGSVGRRLHHRLRPGLLLPPLLQQPRLLVGTLNTALH